MNRAYSLLEVKRVEDDSRIIMGIATTPTPDRVGDIVEPLGVSFKNPLPLLWHHRADQPVGTVVFDEPNEKGIRFQARLPKIADAGPLKDRIDTAWAELKAGLVRGVSIGFRSLESSFLKEGGIRFLKSEVLELSLVTIPAQAEATIQTIKSIDSDLLAASGTEPIESKPSPASRVVQLKKPKEALRMATIAEQITALEAKRAASVARLEEIQNVALDAGRTKDAAERESSDELRTEVESIDAELRDLRSLEKIKATTARPVAQASSQVQAAEIRSYPHVVVKARAKLPPGIGFARYAKCLALSSKQYRDPAVIAESLYGPDSVVVETFKTDVPAGTTLSGSWTEDLVGAESTVFADFAEYLRPMTILGKFGTGGIPSLRNVPFRVALVGQDQGGDGYWVGEAKAKPLTKFGFTRTTLTPLKVANIAVLTEEVIRDSSPKAEAIIRDQLAAALRARLDIDFVNPSESGTPGVQPASITNGATVITSEGPDNDDIRLDVRSLMQTFIDDNNPPSNGVWIMSTGNALALNMAVNELGQPAFPGIGMSGGIFFGMPVITSEHVGNNVILVNASDIYLADDGGIRVDVSREASLEMADNPSHDSSTPSDAQLVSMFQTNSVALRAERTINWAARRDSAVAYMGSVNWGGPTNST